MKTYEFRFAGPSAAQLVQMVSGVTITPVAPETEILRRWTLDDDSADALNWFSQGMADAQWALVREVTE